MTSEKNEIKKPQKEEYDKKQINAENLKDAVKEIRENENFENDIPTDIQEIKDKFLTGKDYWEQSPTLKSKIIQFSFTQSGREKQARMKFGITRLRTLLNFLAKEYGDLDNFELIFYRRQSTKPFHLKTAEGITKVYVDFDAFQQYTEKISLAIKNLKVSKYYWKVRWYFQKKVLTSFFENEPTSSLIEELKNSYHGVIEEILSEYENMPESEEKKDLRSIVMQSALARDTVKEISQLTPESPKKQLMLFLPVIKDLPPKEFEILLKNLFKSNKSSEFLKYIGSLPADQLQKIIKKLPAMDTMFNLYEKLSKSLKEFEKLIDKHIQSETNDEAEIHKFLTKHYWLLGIEYVDKPKLSDYDFGGKRVNETKLDGSMKHPDFIIKRLDGFDKCVVIELEDANDPIFKKNGEFSKKVYDGILQAADYNIEQKFRDLHSKGIAVIGSTKGMSLDKEKKKRFKLLVQEFPNIEILTYDDIIAKAKSTLDFWKESSFKEKFEPEI